MKYCISILALLIMPALSSLGQDTLQLKLLFFGDIMQHDSQIQGAYDVKLNTYNYQPCFEPLQELFSNADFVIGNLELTLAGSPYKGYPQFSAPDELALALKEAGVDVLVTANNHSVDRRKQGLERTIRVLDSLGFYYTGTFSNSEERERKYPLIIERDDFKLTLLNYTYGTNGIPVNKPNIVNLIDTAQIRIDLDKAKSFKPDAIIVFMHWGNEYDRNASKAQKDLAKFCFDNGANMIIGSHPHVLQAAEFYPDKNRLVAYSLGNFVSGQRVRYRDGGMLLAVDLKKIVLNDSTSTTQIENSGYHLAWVHRETSGNKAYRIIPLALADSLLSDSSAKEQLKVFADDSRDWLGKVNVNVPELAWPKQEKDSLEIKYAVQFFTSSQQLDLDHLPEYFRALMYVETTHDGLTKYFIGKFTNREEAELYRKQLIELTNFDDAFIVTLK